MLRWAVLAGGGLVAVALLVFLVGALLPVGHTASVRADVPAPPDTVWAAIADFASHPAWRDGVERMERRPDHEGKPVWREVSSFGTLDMLVEEAVPGRLLVTRIVGDGQPFGGSWTFRLEPAGEGTRVTVTEDGEVYNAFFRFMSRFVFGHYATLESYLRSLGRRFDAEVETVRSK